MKRAQEQRVDEVSLQKSSHETIQKLTSQLQEMQDQMNSTNDSGEFQEVAWNHSGKLAYVSSQLAMIPSSRSMVSRDKRLPRDTWNTSGLQENVFGNQFSTFDSPRFPQRISSDDVQEEWESNTSSGSEMPVRTVSQKFSHLQWRRLFKELWSRPTTTADFGSPL